MSFRIWAESLPVSQIMAKRLDLSNRSVIVLQHAVSDTVRLLHHLRESAWARNIHFIAKPFSMKPRRMEAIVQAWNTVYSELDYLALEKSGYLAHVIEEASRSQRLPPLILEVGGCFAQVLSEWQNEIAGVVEVTTFGHNRYQSLIDKIGYPVHSIARSKIKHEEANHVWQSVTTSLDVLLKELGRDLSSGKVLMVWYGMIGKAVATSLKGRGIQTSVYDTAAFERHEAAKRWFETHSNIQEILSSVDMIVSSTGGQWITAEIIQACPDWIILVSAGSRQNEIDIEYLERNATKKRQIHKHMKGYVIHGKEVFVVREWKNVNFIGESCPDTCMDLIHAGVLSCARNILNGKKKKKWIIYEPNTDEIEEIYRLHEEFWREKTHKATPLWKIETPDKLPAPPMQWELLFPEN